MGRTFMSILRITAISLTAFFLLLGGAGVAAAAELSMDDAKLVGAYPLTMDKVQRKFAVAADLGRLSVTDPALQKQLQTINEAKNLDAQIKAFSAVPQAAAAMQAHGISARDYCLTTLAIGYALMPHAPAQFRQGNSPPDPSDVAAPPEHVEFVQAHNDEIHKLIEAIMQARKEAQR
jgi:hypothetical protein